MAYGPLKSVTFGARTMVLCSIGALQLDSDNVYASAPVSSCPVGCTNAEACNLIQSVVVDEATCFHVFRFGLGRICSDAKMFILNDTVHFDAMDYPNGEPLLGVWSEAQNNGSFSGSNGGFEVNLVARRVWLLQFVLRRLFVCGYNLLCSGGQ